MVPDPPSPGFPPAGDPHADPALEQALREVRSLAGNRFEILGPLGRDLAGEFAFLARDPAQDRLAVLKRAPGTSGELTVIDRLDSSVPPPAGGCPVCQAPFAGWEPFCPECGADVTGSLGSPGPGVSRDQLLAAVREAAVGLDVLGYMPRARGGASVYFAREGHGGAIVALRLDQEVDPGKRSRVTVAATRMMRPKLLYGTVSGEAREGVGPSLAGSRPPWTPVPSPFGATAGASPGARVCPNCGETFGPEHRFCPKDGATLRTQGPVQDLVGQVIAERYHILSKLGEGGMGRVYLAEHVRMGRRCAVKVMNPSLLYDPDSVSRFNREAANASGISHPNVVAIYDFGESNDVVYLAMEYVEGESLAGLLERERALSESRAADIARQVADGLSAAHELGIVHRDLKPDNVMLSRSRSGRDIVKVVDFGIAKATRGGRQTVTRTGYVVGTPAYMSPEQILGDALDPRSDVYSLGCILYEMLTGGRAFADASGEVSIRQRLTEPPPRPRQLKHGLSARLDGIVTKAMARGPEQRFQTAAEFRDALAALPVTPAAKPGKGWWRWGRSAESGESQAHESRAGAEAFTAPVPLGWSEVGQVAPKPPVLGATALRHRSARPSGGKGVWVAVAGGTAVLLALGGAWWLWPRPEEPVAMTSNKIVVEPSRPSPPAPEPPPPAAPDAGTLWIGEPPPGARVTVDGADAAVALDGSLTLPFGPHTIVVEAPGYRTVTRSVVVDSTRTDSLRLRYSQVSTAPRTQAPAPEVSSPEPPSAPPPAPPAAPGSGRVSIAGSLPPNAEISVEGTVLPLENGVVEIAPGEHWFKVSAAGYRPDSALLEVRKGAETVWQPPHLQRMPEVEATLTVMITMPDTTIAPGGVVQVEAAVKDQSGTYLDRPISWESSNSKVVSVGDDGRLTAAGPGRAYVRARSGNGVDSTLVTVPAPRVPKPPPGQPARAIPAVPTGEDIQKAIAACSAALGSGNERQIVQAYKAQTAQDITNLRKILDVALRKESDFKAAPVDQAPPTLKGTEASLPFRFTWRNNAGVNKRKDVAFQVELGKSAEGWRLASCRATEKIGF